MAAQAGDVRHQTAIVHVDEKGVALVLRGLRAPGGKCGFLGVGDHRVSGVINETGATGAPAGRYRLRIRSLRAKYRACTPALHLPASPFFWDGPSGVCG